MYLHNFTKDFVLCIIVFRRNRDRVSNKQNRFPNSHNFFLLSKPSSLLESLITQIFFLTHSSKQVIEMFFRNFFSCVHVFSRSQNFAAENVMDSDDLT